MGYISREDVEAIIYSEELDVIQQADETKFAKAVASTVDYFKGFLRSRYDVETLFTAWDGVTPVGDPRPAALVSHMCDHVLCFLYKSQPDRMIPEHRIEACDKVQEWLDKINNGDIEPGFPTVDTEAESDTLNPIQWGSNSKVSSNW